METLTDYNASLLDFNAYHVIDPNSWSMRIDLPHGLESCENIYLRTPALEYGKRAMYYVSEDLENVFDHDTDKRWLLYYTNAYMGTASNYYLWAPLTFINIGIATPEMYLIAAECSARTGELDDALYYLNELRRHRYTVYEAFEADTEEKIVREVLNERRRELAMYGLNRLFDLKRINKEPRFAKEIIHKLEGPDEAGNEMSETHILKPNDNKYALPIAPSVMRYSPNMVNNPR